jgi:hypothetical protein
MSLITIAVVNASLAIAIVGTLAYVCRLPFGLDRLEPASDSQALNQAPDGELLAA